MTKMILKWNEKEKSYGAWFQIDEENEKTKSVVRCCTAIFDYSKFNYYWK